MPGLKYTRSSRCSNCAHIRNQFHYGVDRLAARQEVINRLQFTQLPPGVTPQISPESPTGEIFRYTLSEPQGRRGRTDVQPQRSEIVQDWTLERLFRRLPRIIDVTSFGGTANATKSIPIRPA